MEKFLIHKEKWKITQIDQEKNGLKLELLQDKLLPNNITKKWNQTDKLLLLKLNTRKRHLIEFTKTKSKELKVCNNSMLIQLLITHHQKLKDFQNNTYQILLSKRNKKLTTELMSNYPVQVKQMSLSNVISKLLKPLLLSNKDMRLNGMLTMLLNPLKLLLLLKPRNKETSEEEMMFNTISGINQSAL
jgi:hypothetical protein